MITLREFSIRSSSKFDDQTNISTIMLLSSSVRAASRRALSASAKISTLAGAGAVRLLTTQCATSAPSKLTTTALASLNTVQLCNLVHVSGLPDCVPFITAQKLTGLHIVDGVDSHEDLVNSGLNVIKAKTLYKRIVEWKNVGLPTSFDITSSVPIPNTPSTPSAASRNTDQISASSLTEPVIDANLALNVEPEQQQPPVALADPTIHLEQDYNTARWCSDTAAAERILQAASQGDPIAQLHMCVLYEKGCKSFPKDAKKALEYAHMALPWLQANTTNASAQYYLGYLHMNGIALPKSESEGVRYHQLAADQGLSIALNALGTCYLFGVGLPKYEEVGVSYFRKAIEKGSIVGEINLACCYGNGTGIEVNETEAVRLYRKPAELGYANVQHYLGLYYLEGKGVVQNDQKALKHLLSAAAQDYVDSILLLGYMHEVGKGVEVNMNTALKYYQRGVALGSEYAVHAVERVVDRADEVAVV